MKIIIVHQYINKKAAKQILTKMDDLLRQTSIINSKIDQMATTQDRIEAAISNLDSVTNGIAGELQKLRDEINAGSVSDATLTKLDESIDKLKALGADPANPVPTPEPTPTPAPEPTPTPAPEPTPTPAPADNTGGTTDTGTTGGTTEPTQDPTDPNNNG